MKRTIIALDYFDRFKCIGGDCPRTCCNGWKVIIDNDTYEKYLKCNNEVTDITKESIRIVDGEYTVKMKENGDCPFLTEDGLCCVQKNMGVSYLSETCDLFPRVLFDYKNFVTASLSIACPEVTNKLVHEKKKYNIEYYLSAEDATEEDDVWIGLFKLLLEILQYDRYSFNTRFRLVISILGVIDNIKADEDKVKEFVKLFDDKQIFIQQMNVNDLKDSQIQKYMLFLCRSFADNIKVSNCGNLYIYKYIAEYLFSLDVDNINGEVKAKTQSMNRYEYIFEKYMCAFIHRHFFPMVVLNDFMTKIRVMVYSYNFYRLVCFAMLEKKEFSLDGFAEVIYSMDRDFEHTYASGLAELGLFNPNASIEDLLGLI